MPATCASRAITTHSFANSIINFSVKRWTEYGELAGLFFLHGMAMGIWLVPLSRVLAAHGMETLRPFAYATSALAAFVSPLIFGAMADHHAAPAQVLRWLSAACAAAMAMVSWSIG